MTNIVGSANKVYGTVCCYGEPNGDREHIFNCAIKERNILHIRPHDFWHAFATRYTEEGDVVLKDVLEQKDRREQLPI